MVETRSDERPGAGARRKIRWRTRAAVAGSTCALLLGAGGALAVWAAAPSAASAPTPGWTPTQAPVPSDPDPIAGNGMSLTAESCPSAVFCAAVGGYQGASFGEHSVAEVLSGGSWTASVPPLPTGVEDSSANAGLTGVSCPAQGWCVAIGSYQDASFTVIDTYSGGAWTAIRAPAPHDSSGTFENLTALSCPAPGSCFAIGNYSNGSNEEQFVDTLSAGTWTAQLGALPSGSTLEPSWGVISCPTTTFCGAASSALTPGDAQEGTPAVPVVLILSGGTWSSQSAPLPNTAGSGPSDFDNVNAISCANGACEAAGYFDDTSGAQQVLLEHWGGAGWSALTGPLPSSLQTPSPSAAAAGVSCTFDGYCAVVGQYRDASSAVQPFVESVTGGTPSLATVPMPSVGQPSAGGQLNAVSCVAANSCTAVGAYTPSGGIAAGLIDQLSGTTWSAVPAPTPSNSESPAEVSLNAVSCSGRGACDAAGTYVAQGPITEGLLEAYTPAEGYWSVAADGGVFTYNAVFHGSMGGQHNTAPVGGLAATPGAGGYGDAGADGGVYNFGNAAFYGSAGSLRLNAPVVGIAATPDGQGYWLVAADGGVFNYGDAGFFGSRGGQPLNKPIVGIAATPDGGGYWLVAADGGIFSYGDALFYGSRGGQPLNKPVVGIGASTTGLGYWLVASDGGIFNYGDAGFYGSRGGQPLNKPIVGVMSTFDGAGYWLVASDGGIFSYGDAGFQGSAGSLHLNAPVTGGAPT